MRHETKKIAFMSSAPIALPVLDALFEQAVGKVVIAGIFTQPDRPHGRGRHLKPNAIKRWSIERKVPVLQPEPFHEAALEWVQANRIDVLLVMAYGHILRPALLESVPLGAVNLHASLLPAFRGASPIASALAAGATVTGVTLMQMTAEMDAGPIADSERCIIPNDADAETLGAALAQAAVPLVQRNLSKLLTGELEFKPQDEAHATYTRKLTKSDGRIDFNKPAVAIERRIRALHPWPGCFFNFQKKTIKIGRAEANETAHDAKPGQVLAHSADALVVAVGTGTLRLKSLQRPGGRLLPAADFLRGLPIPIGSVLEGGPMNPLLVNRTAEALPH